MGNAIFRQTELPNRSQLSYLEVFNIVKLLQVDIAEHQTFYALDSAFRIPEHGTLKNKRAFQLH